MSRWPSELDTKIHFHPPNSEWVESTVVSKRRQWCTFSWLINIFFLAKCHRHDEHTIESNNDVPDSRLRSERRNGSIKNALIFPSLKDIPLRARGGKRSGAARKRPPRYFYFFSPLETVSLYRGIYGSHEAFFSFPFRSLHNSGDPEERKNLPHSIHNIFSHFAPRAIIFTHIIISLHVATS